MRAHLVTGATGYLGQALTRALLERGDTVGILIRGDRASAVKKACQLFPDYASEYGSRLQVFTGDVTTPGLELSPPIAGLIGSEDLCVWHLAASLSFNEEDRQQIIRTNTDGSRNVAEFANRHAARLHHVSTAFVCGDTRAVFREDQLERGQRFHNWYEQSKFEAEKIIRTECRVPFLIFRPAIIVGETGESKASNCTFGYYRFTSLFYLLKRRLIRIFTEGPLLARLALKALGTRYEPAKDILNAPWLILPYPLKSTVNLVHIEDVVKAMLEADISDVPDGTTFHLSQPMPPTFIFLLKSLMSDMNLMGVKYVGLPAPLFREFFYSLYYLLSPLFSRQRNRHYFKSLLQYLPYISQNHRFSIGNAEAYLAPSAPLTRERLRIINGHSSDSDVTDARPRKGAAERAPDSALLRPFRTLNTQEAASSLLKITYGGEL